MSTNPYFNNYDPNGVQANLLDDLVIESIQIHGIDLYYVTRKVTSEDEILNEDDLPVFDAAYVLEMYVKSVDGFGGEGDFLSKFGLTIRDQVTLTVAHRTFEKFVTQMDAQKTRPQEGDLIYLPLNNKFFKIMHVEHESVFYQMGKLYVYDLQCELLEYSNQRFNTGVSFIDTYFNNINTSAVTSLEGLEEIDNNADNIFFENESDSFLNFEEQDPFSENIDNPTKDKP